MKLQSYRRPPIQNQVTRIVFHVDFMKSWPVRYQESIVHHIWKKQKQKKCLHVKMNMGIQFKSRLMALHLFDCCMYPACQSTDSSPVRMEITPQQWCWRRHLLSIWSRHILAVQEGIELSIHNSDLSNLLHNVHPISCAMHVYWKASWAAKCHKSRALQKPDKQFDSVPVNFLSAAPT